jgi:alpha-tubulin suppressor-like RCC1 family protein
VVVANTHACALTTAGAAYCWGDNSNNALGGVVTTPSASFKAVPSAVTGGHTFTSLAIAGSATTCGVRTDGAILCWGNYQNGLLGRMGFGIANDPNNYVPTPVAFSFTATRIVGGSNHFCAANAAGNLACWGSAQSGQLGRAGTPGEYSETPNVISSPTFTSFTASAAASCGVANGSAYCWGENGSGTVGDGSYTTRTSPTAVSGGLGFKSVSSNYSAYTVCGITTADVLYCWGSGSYGMLGQGTYVGTSNVPLQVRFP